MDTKLLSNQPPKGTSDWFPDEFRIRKYIFDVWREVCTKYGYEEYLTPIIESAQIYKAKSGEEVGGKQLMTMTDRSGRELAIRPEMTPSVVRMISRIYDGRPKPIRYFSIANFLRNEKPQRGRNREFWQLNFDIFGSDSIQADIEILEIAIEIMLSFKPPEDSFTVYINSRKLVEDLFSLINLSDGLKPKVFRVLDRWNKMADGEAAAELQEYQVDEDSVNTIKLYMTAETEKDLLKAVPGLEDKNSLKEIQTILKVLNEKGYEKWIKFQPNIVRGLDYYDGMVFEVFDNNSENKRSLFGGGRYNGLAGIFGKNSFPGVGCAPGDETTKLFLESWDLIERNIQQASKYYAPIIDESLRSEFEKIVSKLRAEGKIVEIGLEIEKIGKALEYANSTNARFVIIFGSQEKEQGIYKVKDLSTGQEAQFEI
ncbi:histidine--tRNA ligase [Candidatus Nomurabacteria bacterium]|nr:histidine--tRNA ligase [Candidatus Nomurabacteria bacterium]